jgi:hypothetical protein
VKNYVKTEAYVATKKGCRRMARKHA